MNLSATDKDALTQSAVDALNDAFKADPAAIHFLIAQRVPCNQALADDPFIVVDQIPVLDPRPYCVGLGGILAGICAAMGIRKIATKWSDEVDEDGRKKMLGFCLYRTDLTSDPATAFQAVEGKAVDLK